MLPSTCFKHLLPSTRFYGTKRHLGGLFILLAGKRPAGPTPHIVAAPGAQTLPKVGERARRSSASVQRAQGLGIVGPNLPFVCRFLARYGGDVALVLAQYGVRLLRPVFGALVARS